MPHMSPMMWMYLNFYTLTMLILMMLVINSNLIYLNLNFINKLMKFNKFMINW